MSLRSVPARWFELLTARDDLTVAVESLARTGAVELEVHSDTTTRPLLPDLGEHLDEYHQLAQRYQAYWPRDGIGPSGLPGRPAETLDEALAQLHAWQQAADPVIQRLESLQARRNDLTLLAEFLQAYGEGDLELGLLSAAGPALAARLFVLPAKTRVRSIPSGVMVREVLSPLHRFLAAVGPPEEVATQEQELLALKARRLTLPSWLRGRAPQTREQVAEHRAALEREIADTQAELLHLHEQYGLHQALGDIMRLDWFLTHVGRLPVSENFAWVTGWTSDSSGLLLDNALAYAGIRGILRYPPAPPDKTPPMVLRNPWWAQPFELFARLLGTPGRDEADPSRLLAVIAPLMFGYMFGDLGQGFVLFLAGLWLQRRWPALRLLIVGGLASMVFGVLFGTVFSREDLIPALWVRPMHQPLTVLVVPMVGGVVILLLGLVLNGVEAYWRGRLREWWWVDAALLALYLALVLIPVHPLAGLAALAALAWYAAGSLWVGRHGAWYLALGQALGGLVESLMQLAVNTLSFVRVGAFALAHAGLSLAVVGLAAAAGHPVGGFVVMLLGNALVIVLEGMVVGIQTTRLVLFEFFIRFLRGEGRIFRPLAAPPGPPSHPRRTT